MGLCSRPTNGMGRERRASPHPKTWGRTSLSLAMLQERYSGWRPDWLSSALSALARAASRDPFLGPRWLGRPPVHPYMSWIPQALDWNLPLRLRLGLSPD